MSRLASNTLRIGDIAPAFALSTFDGRFVQLGEVLSRGPVLLLFAPGTWSPYTRRWLEDLEAAAERFRSVGVAVLVVVAQDAAGAKRSLFRQRPWFPVLTDARRNVARDYGVYRALSLDGIGVTCPAAFLIDGSGAIRFAYVGRNDGDVPEAEVLLNLASWLTFAEGSGRVSAAFPDGDEIWLDENQVFGVGRGKGDPVDS